MTQEELYKIAEQAWEDCDGCTGDDKMFWINGFMRAANLFGDIESLPNLMTEDEIETLAADLTEKLVSNQKNLEPEFSDIIRDNFWDLTDAEKKEKSLEFLADQAQELNMGYGSPYCPICNGCGEDGCCSAINCQQHPDGHYCGTYLNDLKVDYLMGKWFYEEVYETLSPEKKEECDVAYDNALDRVHGKKQGD